MNRINRSLPCYVLPSIFFLLLLLLPVVCTIAQDHSAPTSATDASVRVNDEKPSRIFRRRAEVRPTERTGSTLKKSKKKTGRWNRQEAKVYKPHSRAARQRENTRKTLRGPRKNYLRNKE